MTAAPDVGAAGRRCCSLRHLHACAAPTCAVTPPCDLISGRILGPPGGSEIRVGGSVARSRRLSSAAQGKERDIGVWRRAAATRRVAERVDVAVRVGCFGLRASAANPR